MSRNEKNDDIFNASWGKKNRYNFLFVPFVKASDILKSSGKILQIPILSKREIFSLCKKKEEIIAH